MQFQHPHFFRFQVRAVLEEHAPTMWDAVVATGCVVNAPPPGVPETATTVAARRSALESALRRSLAHDPAIDDGPSRDELLDRMRPVPA
ncbi:MAG: hypothetical protein JWM62_2946 [Frankiales bacterium]|nr:hypothetical protein [Frankiales bacterium]